MKITQEQLNEVWVLVGLVVSAVLVIGYIGYIGLNWWFMKGLPF